MIIYGTRSAHLRTENLKSTICPKCKTQGSLWMSAFRKHAHIFWIPLFPLHKIAGTECKHCKSVMRERDMPGSILQTATNLKSASKGPIWQFSGLILVVSLFTYAIVQSKMNSSALNEKLTNPAIGDLYEIKTDIGSYTYFKLSDISGDSVYFHTNKFVLSKYSHLEEINKEENYLDTETEVFHKDSLTKKLNTNTVVSILRD